MSELLRFALLGLGSGAVYALAAQGIVVIYRGSGVLNFSQGAIGLLSATLFVRTWHEYGWPLWLAIVLGVGAAAVTGAVVFLAVMRPLHRRSQLVRLVASLGVLSVVQQGLLIGFGAKTILVPPFLASGQLEVIDGASIGYDRLTILGVAVALSLALGWYFRSTRLGMATLANNDDPIAAAALGWSSTVIGCVNWVIGASLGGLAGVFIVAISGLSPVALTLVILPAFAAALASRFQSFVLALAYALALGVGQALLVRYGANFFDPVPGLDPDGWADALPFVLIVLVLVARGSVIPRRGELSEMLPRVGLPLRDRRLPLAGAAVLVVFVALGPGNLVSTIVTSLLLGLVGLSVVLLAGYAGQLSLGQMAIAGIAALVAGRLSGSAGWPFLLAAAFGVVAAIGAGTLFALPSLRSRGLALAVVTLGLGVAVQKVVFANPRYTGGFSGTVVEHPTLFGWDISSSDHPKRYAVVVALAFVGAALLVGNVRRGKLGRRLLAVRSNEHAAASLGISMPATKITAFGLAAAIAAVGGVLLGFRFSAVQYNSFDLFASLQVVILTVIGGTGYVAGAVLGALMAPGGIGQYFIDLGGNAERWFIFISGALLLVVIVTNPDGQAHVMVRQLRQVRSRLRRKARPEGGRTSRAGRATRRPPDVVAAPAPVTLTVEGASVKFGHAVILDGVSLTVPPGRVVGLIGPNGAGKTTLLEAISGYVRLDAGRVLIDQQVFTSPSARDLARLGLRRSFQGVESFEDLTVAENLVVAHERMRASGMLRELLRPTPATLTPRLEALAERFGLVGDLDASPESLAFGRRRLLGVARAMAGHPSVLLLDEPASGLSATERSELCDLVRQAARDDGIGVLLVEHDVELVVGLCDEVVVLDVGKVIFRGAPEDLLDDALVRSAYLGDLFAGDPSETSETSETSGAGDV
jgi:ABC-type branched-subunit amino acid transport system ATPase component/branched-subunit amino acid ABC-type transport system permease component